jgi:hypothetical protein
MRHGRTGQRRDTDRPQADRLSGGPPWIVAQSGSLVDIARPRFADRATARAAQHLSPAAVPGAVPVPAPGLSGMTLICVALSGGYLLVRSWLRQCARPGIDAGFDTGFGVGFDSGLVGPPFENGLPGKPGVSIPRR